LWDADFEDLAHGKAFFLPHEDKNRLSIHDEDSLHRDSLNSAKLFPWLTWPMTKWKIAKCPKTTKVRRSWNSAKKWTTFKWRSVDVMAYTKKLSISIPRRPKRHWPYPKRRTSF